MAGFQSPGMRGYRLTLVLAVLTLAVLSLTGPGAWQKFRDHGEIYLFSWQFFADIPDRLLGPGRLRFLLQPSLAIALGVRDGLADARTGRSRLLSGLVRANRPAWTLVASGLGSIANLVLMAILLDVVFQWAILGVAYPGAALVVGPVLIAAPYTLARTLANRGTRSG